MRKGNPASGFRTGWAGSLSNVGSTGYAWSGSPHAATSSLGTGISASSTNVHTLSNNARADGYPVRCVQE